MKNTNKLKIRNTLIFTLLLLTLACATKPTPAKPVPMPSTLTNNSASNSIAVQNAADWFIELNFEKDSANLSDSDRTALNGIIEKTNPNRAGYEIKAISWADHEYPGKKHKGLSKRQKQLADQRNDQIVNYIKEHAPTLEVKTYNMAKRPNSIQDLLETSDARTKASIEKANWTYWNGRRVHLANQRSTSLILSIQK